jgi:hypothetical protein
MDDEVEVCSFPSIWVPAWWIALEGAVGWAPFVLGICFRGVSLAGVFLFCIGRRKCGGGFEGAVRCFVLGHAASSVCVP